MMYSFLDSFILFYFEFHSATWICRLLSLTNWEVFCNYFKHIFFSSALFLLLFRKSSGMNVRSFVIIPQVLEALFIFFQSIFSLLFRLGISVLFSSWLLSLSSLFCHQSCPLSFLFWSLYFSVLKTLPRLFHSWASYLYFSHIHNCSFKHFYYGCFTPLSENFNISFISVLASTYCSFSISLKSILF